MNQEIRDQLERYIAGVDSLEAFEDWFLPATWNDRDQLTSEIRLRLAEHDRGDLTEDELRWALFALLEGEFTRTDADTANVVVTVRDLAAVA